MDTNSAATIQPGMPFRALGPFFALAFGLGWGIAILALVFTAQVEALFGPVSGTNPVFILVVYTPGIAGVALVWWHCGVAGLGRYFRRLALWRAPGSWWLFLLLGLIVLLGPAIAAQTANQLATGIAFTPPEVAGPIGGFAILGLLAIWVMAALLHHLAPPVTPTGHG